MDYGKSDALRRCQPAFIQSLNTIEVLDDMIAGGHISDDERERITAQITSADRARTFLDILMRKSDDAFDCFQGSLSRLQYFLAELLEEQLKKTPFSK